MHLFLLVLIPTVVLLLALALYRPQDDSFVRRHLDH